MEYNFLSQTCLLPSFQKNSKDCNYIVQDTYDYGFAQDCCEENHNTLPLSDTMNINRNFFLERMAEWEQITQQYKKSLNCLRSELFRVEQRERSRLAGELHDYLAQMLVVCKMKVDRLKNKTDSGSNQSIVQELEELLDQSINFTRTLMSDLSPKILFEEGLLAALQKLTEQMRHHGLEVILESEIQELVLEEDKTIQLYQMIRELLFNVLKHAQVNRANLKIAILDGSNLVISVKDEGVGFSVPLNQSEDHSQKGFGLWSISERVESLGGVIHVQSIPNQGSKVSLVIPINGKDGI